MFAVGSIKPKTSYTGLGTVLTQEYFMWQCFCWEKGRKTYFCEEAVVEKHCIYIWGNKSLLVTKKFLRVPLLF